MGERRFFTVGHSNRGIDEFIGLLRHPGVQLVVDVRRLRGSDRYPQFNEDALAPALGKAGIEYRPSPELAGRRPRSPNIPPEVNAWWENQSFHNYADHALSDDFRKAIGELRSQGRSRRVAVMCSEAVWWRCHRRIIADYLIASGEQVFHIMGSDRLEQAELSSGAVTEAGPVVTYPASS